MVEIGDNAPDFTLEDASGQKHSLSDYKGKRILLSFHRYAACPICRYSIDRLAQQAQYFSNAGIKVINILPSSNKGISKYINKTQSDDASSFFLTLSDPSMHVFDLYKNKYDKILSMKHACVAIRIIRQSNGKIKHASLRDIPFRNEKKGTIVPAEFLIDEDGKIFDVHFCDPSFLSTIPWERIEAFIPEEKRCRCNGEHCLSPTCRKNYAEILASFSVFTG